MHQPTSSGMSLSNTPSLWRSKDCPNQEADAHPFRVTLPERVTQQLCCVVRLVLTAQLCDNSQMQPLMEAKAKQLVDNLETDPQKVTLTADSQLPSVMKAGYKGAVRSSAPVVNHNRAQITFTQNTSPGQFTYVLFSPELYTFIHGYLEQLCLKTIVQPAK